MAGPNFLLSYLPFSPHIRPLHAATYLLGVSLFSISFLVFLNASVSFVLTDLLHRPPPIGDIVGTLGFADEMVAVVAAPCWGAASDGRLGTRGVAVIGFAVIAGALVLFVNVASVYPGLLLARMCFSVGAAAVATMVSAMLPEMTAAAAPLPLPLQATPVVPQRGRRMPTPPPSEIRSPGVPADIEVAVERGQPHPTGKLAGLVGLFTGLGALLALGLFLPLPAHFAEVGGSREVGVRRAFYCVAVVAVAVGVWCLLGLPAPPAKRESEGTGWVHGVKKWVWTKVWGGDPAVMDPPSPVSPASCASRKSGARAGGSNSDASTAGGLVSLKAAVSAGWHDSRIALSYLGGFVARSTSVGISLFVPLLVNHHYIVSGKCPADARDDPKHGCREAYLLAAALTGMSQLAALLGAPVFGWWSDRAGVRNAPLVVSGLVGVVGFSGLALAGQGQGEIKLGLWCVGCVVMMGVAQIGGIVGSLGSLGKGIVEEEEEEEEEQEEEEVEEGYFYDEDAREIGEEEPLLRRSDSNDGSNNSYGSVGEENTVGSRRDVNGRGRGRDERDERDERDGGNGRNGRDGRGIDMGMRGRRRRRRRRRDVKGGIAGVYSLCGGVGILALTKLGGWGFDQVSVGWPFWMLAVFEGALVVGAVAESVWGRK